MSFILRVLHNLKLRISHRRRVKVSFLDLLVLGYLLENDIPPFLPFFRLLWSGFYYVSVVYSYTFL